MVYELWIVNLIGCADNVTGGNNDDDNNGSDDDNDHNDDDADDDDVSDCRVACNI